MEPIAHVREIWRYPVKSMGGEPLSSSVVTPAGLPGDRVWAVVDSKGEIKSARQWQKLIWMTASFVEAAHPGALQYSDAVPNVIVSTPEGARIHSRASNTAQALEDFLGQPCRLEPLRSPSSTDFYTPPKERNRENREVEVGKFDEEPDFDFAQTPEEMLTILGQYMTPPGTFFDAFPIHMISTQSMAYLADAGAVHADPRRFRPNLLLEFVDGSTPAPEFDLLGKLVHIGKLRMRIQGKTVRCTIPSQPQPLLGLTRDKNMTRAMVQLFERHVGVYASIEEQGEIHVGDPVFVDA